MQPTQGFPTLAGHMFFHVDDNQQKPNVEQPDSTVPACPWHRCAAAGRSSSPAGASHLDGASLVGALRSADPSLVDVSTPFSHHPVLRAPASLEQLEAPQLSLQGPASPQRVHPQCAQLQMMPLPAHAGNMHTEPLYRQRTALMPSGECDKHIHAARAAQELGSLPPPLLSPVRPHRR